MHKAGAIVLLIAALSGVIWMAFAGTRLIRQWLFAGNDRFAIQQLDITSTGRLSPAHIREFGGITEGQNLFAVDIKDIRDKLEAGPLIKSAEVQRLLPSTLAIHVNERIPVARVAHGQAGFYFSVDIEGHVLGLAGRSMASIPVVKGFSDRGLSPGSTIHDGNALDAIQVIDLCDHSPIGQVVHIDAIDVSNSEYLEMTLQSGMKVLLPRNPARSKLEDLVVFLRESGGRINFIDLTVDRNIPAT